MLTISVRSRSCRHPSSLALPACPRCRLLHPTFSHDMSPQKACYVIVRASVALTCAALEATQTTGREGGRGLRRGPSIEPSHRCPGGLADDKHAFADARSPLELDSPRKREKVRAEVFPGSP